MSKLGEEIQSSFKSKSQEVYINLLYTNYKLEQKSKNFFKQYDITPQQYNVIRILKGNEPDTCSNNYIKKRIMDKMSDVSRLITRLDKKGLITRKTSKEDKRASEIKLNEKGLQLLSNIELKINTLKEPINKLTLLEQQKLNELLNKIRD